MAEWRFDRFIVQPERRRLLIDGEPAKVGARAFDVLVALAERRHRVVTKTELLDLVWPNAAVEEGNLQVQIFALRKLLGAAAIATIPGRGYQFAAAIDGQEPAAAPTRPGLATSGRSRRPGNLPLRLPPLYGREADAAALQTLIAENRLVTIVGPGGIGKTRVAQAVAHQLPNPDGGVWLIELAPIMKPELTVTTVARALGLALKGNTLASLIEAICRQELVLVLDNCEHLTDAVRDLARAILADVPGVRLLVTSQEPLRLVEERVNRLGPLAVPVNADAATALDHGAVALFAARAQAVDARFKVEEGNVSAVVEICARLDGIALAIELAAARIALLGVHGVRQRLDERFQLLAGGPRAALPRHRALSAALEWSYGLLCDDEQEVLDKLGIFVGGFSLEAAQELIADERIDRWMVLEHLSSLVDKSLVIVDPGEPPRYRLLETTRAFALNRLGAKDAVNLVRRRHALALIAVLQSLGFKKSPPELALGFAADIDNLRAAAAWATGPEGDRAIAIELAAEAGQIWHVLGINDEGGNLFRTVEAWVDPSTPRAVSAKLQLSRAKLYPSATRTAAEEAMEAASVFRALGYREHLFDALINAAAQFNYAGDFSAAERVLVEAKTLLNPEWPRWTRISLEIVASGAKYWAGATADSRAGLRLALELCRDGGDAYQTEWIEMMLVGCDTALRNSCEVLRTSGALLQRDISPLVGFNRAVVESFRGAALVQVGKLDEAEALFRAAFPRILRALGTARTTLCHLAFLLARRGRCADAARLLGAVDALRPAGAAILAPPNRASYDDAATIIVQTLGKLEFARLKAEGSTLSEDEAVTLAFASGKDGMAATP